jgi:hypothetical protein
MSTGDAASTRFAWFASAVAKHQPHNLSPFDLLVLGVAPAIITAAGLESGYLHYTFSFCD